MTEVTYRALSEAAFEEMARLSALGVRSEDIVMVVTQDVFWAASVYESRWCLNHNVQELTVAAKFYGHDVGVINEEADTMFRAAIKGLYGSQDMEPGTLMVIDDDNQARIYAMERSNGRTTQLRDIGLTVAFGYDREMATAATTTDVAARAVADMLLEDPLFAPTANMFRYMEPTFATGYDRQWAPSPFTQFLIQDSPKTRTIGSVSIKPKKKAEVQPDTTALDEFLGSFKVLKSAT